MEMGEKGGERRQEPILWSELLAEPYEITNNTYADMDVDIGIDDTERNKGYTDRDEDRDRGRDGDGDRDRIRLFP